MAGGPAKDKLDRPLPRRFYSAVEVAGDSPPFGILLDGRPVKTPMKKPLAVNARGLADALKREWLDQGEHINPATMPLNRLANTAVDHVEPREGEIVAEIVGFAGSDLLCYRASRPEELCARQSAHWDPVLSWCSAALDAEFVTTSEITHIKQPDEALSRLSEHLARNHAFALAAVHNITTLTGSGLLATALANGAIAPDVAWHAAHVDEDWQIEQWGEDWEAKQHRDRRRDEFDQTVEFLSLALS